MTPVGGAVWRWRQSNCARAWSAWALFAGVIGALAIAWPESRTVTPNYREACFRWFAAQDIYCSGPHGFLYFPQAAVLFAPFAYLPCGDFLWRVFGISGLAIAVKRWSETLPSGSRAAGFAWMTAAAIPPALASARNGQMNLVLASSMALALVAVANRRWNQAAFWLCFGVAMKPLMAVPLAVAACCYRPLLKPLTIGMLLVAALPFVAQQPEYAMRQHRLCFEKLLLAASPGPQNPASDLFGLLASFGFAAPPEIQFVTRAFATTALLGLCIAVVRRRPRRTSSALVLTFLACYLTLFNPRAENNGYVVLAPALGVWTAWGLRGGRQRTIGWLTMIVSWAIAGSYELTQGPNFWLNPLLTLALLSCAMASGLRSRNRRFLQAGRAAPRRPPGSSPTFAAPSTSDEPPAPDHELTVVIPAFNEQRRLPRTLRSLIDGLDEWGIDYRILVVDDGSQDETAAVSQAFGPRVQCLRLARRSGKGQAVKCGMLSATGRVIAFTDADLPYSLAALRNAYQAISSGGFAAAFGSRALPGSVQRVATPLRRRVASAAFRLATRALVSRQLADTQCGLKAFSASAARRVFSRTAIAGFAFDVEVIWLCRQLGIEFECVPVTLVNDYESSISITRDGVRMLFELLKLRFSQGPGRGASGAGELHPAATPALRFLPEVSTGNESLAAAAVSI